MGHTNDEPAFASPELFASQREEVEGLRKEIKSLRTLLVLQAARLRHVRESADVAKSRPPEPTKP